MARISLVIICGLLTVAIAHAKEEIPTNVVAGKKVPADAVLKVGDKLVGEWEKKDYLVEVIEVKKDKKVRIHWIGFDKSFDDDSPIDVLYFPASTDPTRKKRSSPLPAEYQIFDKDGDWQIGLYEWPRARYAEFQKLDKNRDGFLTPKELAGKGATTTATASADASKDSKDAGDPKPDPGNLESYKDKIKETVKFKVTGKKSGTVWGTGVYTLNSELATAAVHAGILKDGEAGTVTVTIVDSPEMFSPSEENGIASSAAEKAPAAFMIK